MLNLYMLFCAAWSSSRSAVVQPSGTRLGCCRSFAGPRAWMEVVFPQIAVAFPGFTLQTRWDAGAGAGTGTGELSNGGASLIL